LRVYDEALTDAVTTRQTRMEELAHDILTSASPIRREREDPDPLAKVVQDLPSVTPHHLADVDSRLLHMAQYVALRSDSSRTQPLSYTGAMLLCEGSASIMQYEVWKGEWAPMTGISTVPNMFGTSRAYWRIVTRGSLQAQQFALELCRV